MYNLNFLFEGVQWDDSADAEWKATDGIKMKILILTSNKKNPDPNDRIQVEIKLQHTGSTSAISQPQ